MNTRESGAASTDTVDNVEVDTDDDRVESGDDGNERAGDGGRKLIKISHNNNTAVHQGLHGYDSIMKSPALSCWYVPDF